MHVQINHETLLPMKMAKVLKHQQNTRRSVQSKNLESLKLKESMADFESPKYFTLK